jgi:general secretion pathway protein F
MLMPVYEYTALNSDGKKLKGIIDADNIASARQKIRSKNEYPVEIKESTPVSETNKEKKIFSLQLTSGVSKQEIHIATRQLATLLSAGIPLVPSLNNLIDQTTNQSLQKIIAQIKNSVNEGNSLSSALTDHPKLFSHIYINMVRAGEASGSLDIVLERLAEFGEGQHALRAKIRAALIYPIFMAVIGTIVLFILMTFIVPNITKVFEDKKQALPLPTTLLMNASSFLSEYWWLILSFFLIVFFLIRMFSQRPKGKQIMDRLKLTAPMLGSLNLKIGAARFSRTLASLLLSGIPLIAALNIVRNILNNVLLAEVINDAINELEKGQSLSNILRKSRWFPPMLVQMIAVGEQSGALEKLLEKVADNYEKEVESKIVAMTSMIEPVMILAMGLVVSFIIVSILLPILEMNQLVR